MGVSAGSGGWHPADEHPVTMSLTPDKSKLRMDHRLTRKVETESFSKESREDAWDPGHTGGDTTSPVMEESPKDAFRRWEGELQRSIYRPRTPRRLLLRA